MAGHIEKALRLKELHDRRDAFVIANPWDKGSARLLAAAGFPALATTGAGLAYSRGEPNGRPGREATLQNAAEIAGAVDVPVSADLENGFGESPESAADTISQAISLGLAGGSIEDGAYRKEDPILDIKLSMDRIAAAAEVIRNSGVPFQLVARAENYLYGRPDLKDTIRRLQCFQEAGADVLYAPGLRTEDEMRAVVSSVDRPVNVVMGLVGCDLTVAKLKAIGVARISVGSALQRLAFGALERAAREMLDEGAFKFAQGALSVSELDRRFESSR